MADSKEKKLRNSILRMVLIYYLAESAFFFLIVRFYKFSQAFCLVFLGVQTIFLFFVSLYLLIKRRFFYLVKSGEMLSSVNLASKITFFRLSMIPFILFLIIAMKNSFRVGHVLAPLIGLTCLSDLFDGYISRRRSEETFMGKILDSACDYLFLGLVAIAYYYYRLLPGWLFWLILSRLLLHSAGMAILFRLRRKLIPQTTLWGKIAVAATMVLFVFKPMAWIFPVMAPGTKFVEIGAGILIGISLADKAIYFSRGIARNSAERQGGFSE